MTLSPRLSLMSPLMRKTGPEMKRQLRYQIVQQELEGETISYCLCEKLNMSGLLYNQRFLWLIDGDSICYGRGIEQTAVIPFKNMSAIPMKSKVIMEDLLTYQIGEAEDDRWLKIEFKGKKAPKVWEFRMNSRVMCLKWKSKLQDSKQKNQRMRLQKTSEGIIKKEQLDVSLYMTPRQKFGQGSRSPSIASPILKPEPQPDIEPIQKIQTPLRKINSIQIKPLKIQKPVIQNQKQLQMSNFKLQLENSRSAYDRNLELDQGFDWQLQFIHADSIPEIIGDFNQYCQALVTKIVDELSNHEIFRTYKPIIFSDYSYEYDIEGFYVKLFWPLPPQQKIKIDPIQQARREMKAFEYILSKKKQQMGLTVPLTSMVTYKGITVYLKTKPKLSTTTLQPKQIHNQIFNFCNLTDISLEAIITKPYSISAADNQNLVLTDGNELFQYDPYNHPHQVYPYIFKQIVKYNKGKGNDDDQSKSNISHRSQKDADSKIQNLGNVAKIYDKIIKKVAKQIQQDLSRLVSSLDFMKILHSRGLSTADLFKIYKLVRLPFTKRFISTMMFIDSFQKIYHFQLYQEMKILEKDKSLQIQKQSRLLDKAIQIINQAILGDKNNDEIWKAIISVTKFHFGNEPSVSELVENLFKHSILLNSGIFIQLDNCIPFDSITRKQAIRFCPKVDSIDIAWTPFYQEVKNMISKNQFDELIDGLSLKTRKLPSHIRICSLEDKILDFLSLNISSLNSQFDHLALYRRKKRISKWIQYQLMVRDFIYLTRGNKEIQANNVKCDNFMKMLSLCYGEQHPLYLDFLICQQKVLVQHYPDNAVKVAQNMIFKARKFQILIGSLKASECYYELALTFFKLSRFEEALHNFQICKTKLNQNSLKDQVYYEITLMMAKLELYCGDQKSCKSSITECIDYYQFKRNYQKQLIECCELLYRTQLIKNEQQLNVYQVCTSILPSIKENQNLEKIIKIIAQKSLLKVQIQVRKQLIWYWKQETYDKLFKFQKKYFESLTNLREIISNEVLVKNLKLLEDKGTQLCKKLLEVKRLPKWKELMKETQNQEEGCLFFLQSLYYFLGEGFFLLC